MEGLNANHITHVACGKNHSLALNQWGQLFAWGSDDCGQLGLDLSENKQQAVPKILKALTTHHIVQIASGENHCMALTNSTYFYQVCLRNYIVEFLINFYTSMIKTLKFG